MPQASNRTSPAQMAPPAATGTPNTLPYSLWKTC